MSDVVLTIGGRAYSVACAAGEEAHIAELGKIIDGKLTTLPGGGGKNDSRALLFAALLLADELYELRNAASSPARAVATRSSGAEMAPEQLEQLAERLEALAYALEVSA